ncbi:uncharacterized protein LOC117127077 [Brassica rapa]|uniref:uncharacterized protein LOC117127077 n=1 Tax=Brassica campestris TaxID=3711 RepID=UPI00142D80A0|nr:uncharacterized protein LOC117127077 [Brassica rapa]
MSSVSRGGLSEFIWPSVAVVSGRVKLKDKTVSSRTADGGETASDRRKRRKWTPADDILLISLWFNKSTDPVVGNEQKSGTFWKRIAAYFAASPRVAGCEEREANHCKQRWHMINDLVCKFCGAYEAATREKASGQNENDVVKHAHTIFYNNYNKKFTLEHAWNELRNDQKWCALKTAKKDVSSKNRKCEDGADSETSQSTENKRPPGVKASKASGYCSSDAEWSAPVMQSGEFLSCRRNEQAIVHAYYRLSNEVPFFRQTQDVTGRLGLSTLQKCTAAIRVLAYGSALDAVDEYLRLGETTARLCVENFVEAVIDLFGDEYLRRPTSDDLQRLLYIGELLGFPGMIGSIDCMHWEWKNCPTV